jgi:pyruvate/2-oxoglutarate dehydrogenase complex dihydrolipoamide acyltransferase (E2) component
MIKPILIPELGDDIKVIKLVEWLVKKGDSVKKGDAIAIVETEKLAFEIESPESGIIEKMLYSNEDKVDVSKPIAYIVEHHEGIDSKQEELSGSEEYITENKQNSNDEPSKGGLRRILRRIINKNKE